MFLDCEGCMFIVRNEIIFYFFPDNTYHIPVCIWLMDTHPQNAPFCYVIPTPDMHIKVSMYVDHNGKVYLPYLHDWQPVSFIQTFLFNDLYIKFNCDFLELFRSAGIDSSDDCYIWGLSTRLLKPKRECNSVSITMYVLFLSLLNQTKLFSVFGCFFF